MTESLVERHNLLYYFRGRDIVGEGSGHECWVKYTMERCVELGEKWRRPERVQGWEGYVLGDRQRVGRDRILVERNEV